MRPVDGGTASQNAWMPCYSNRANKARIKASSTRDARETVAKVDLESLAESVRSNTSYSPSRVETVNEGIEWYNKGISLLRDGKPLEALGVSKKRCTPRQKILSN